MDRLDEMPPVPDRSAAAGAAPYGPVRPPVGRRELYRPTPFDFWRVVGAVALVAVAAGKHGEFAARSGLGNGVIWVLVAGAVCATGAASARILTGRCVGFVPTMIICCTGGITLAALAYGIGEHVARWLT